MALHDPMRTPFRLPHLLLAALVLLTGCMRYNEVELIGVQDAEITRMDATGISAVVVVEVSNPNKYQIQVMDPDVDVFLNDVSIGKASLDSVLVLMPSSTQVYSIPLRTTFNQGQTNLLPLLLGSALTGTMKLGAKGTVVGKARSLRKRFPFELEHEITLR